mgnify:CR=1 FL=1|tara:strand:- start:2082 stop:2246 length:165 start_codon:yes stop_codon:yes gene_type:complete
MAKRTVMERYSNWMSQTSAKKLLKGIGLPKWQIKQKGSQWAVFRPTIVDMKKKK